MKDFSHPYLGKPHCELTGIASPSLRQARLLSPHYHYEYDRRKHSTGVNRWHSTCYRKTIAPPIRTCRATGAGVDPSQNISGRSGFRSNGAQYMIFEQNNPLIGDPFFALASWYIPYNLNAACTSSVGSGANNVRTHLPCYPAGGKHSIVFSVNNRATIANPIIANQAQYIGTSKIPGINNSDLITKLYVNGIFEPGYQVAGAAIPAVNNTAGTVMLYAGAYNLNGELLSLSEFSRELSDKEFNYIFQQNRHKARR